MKSEQNYCFTLLEPAGWKSPSSFHLHKTKSDGKLGIRELRLKSWFTAVQRVYDLIHLMGEHLSL